MTGTACSPVGAVTDYLERHGLKKTDLIPVFGHASRVYDFLNGKRTLSLSQIRRLHETYGIPLELLCGSTAKQAVEPMSEIEGLQRDIQFDEPADITPEGWEPGFGEGQRIRVTKWEDIETDTTSIYIIAQYYCPERKRHGRKKFCLTKDGWALVPTAQRLTEAIRVPLGRNIESNLDDRKVTELTAKLGEANERIAELSLKLVAAMEAKQ
jgi:hypothetical protein